MSQRRSISACALGTLALAGLLGGCASVPPASPPPATDAAAQPGAPTSAPLEPPPRAVADFERAVGLLRAGHAAQAELEFKQLALGHPELAGPHLNLGLLYRKAGKLDQAQQALAAAVERNPASAVAWNELGVTLRMRGKFQEAAAAYERAIAADPDFAPAHRNFAVLLDLYLAEPGRALVQLERYQQLSGEDKPVNGWIAELKQRAGK